MAESSTTQQARSSESRKPGSEHPYWYRLSVTYRIRTNLGLAYTWKYKSATVIVKDDPASRDFVQAAYGALPHKVRDTDNLTIHSSDGPYSSRVAAETADSADSARISKQLSVAQEARAAERRASDMEEDRKRRAAADAEMAAARQEGRTFVVSWTQSGGSKTAVFLEKKQATGKAYDLVLDPSTSSVAIDGPDFAWVETPNERLVIQIDAARESKALINYMSYRLTLPNCIDRINGELAETNIRMSPEDLNDVSAFRDRLPESVRFRKEVDQSFVGLDMVLMMIAKQRKEALVTVTDEGFVRACWRFIGTCRSLADMKAGTRLMLTDGAELVLEAHEDARMAQLFVDTIDGLSTDGEGVLQRTLFDENPFGKDAQS